MTGLYGIIGVTNASGTLGADIFTRLLRSRALPLALDNVEYTGSALCDKLQSVEGSAEFEYKHVDLSDSESVKEALKEYSTLQGLVHVLNPGSDFEVFRKQAEHIHAFSRVNGSVVYVGMAKKKDELSLFDDLESMLRSGGKPRYNGVVAVTHGGSYHPDNVTEAVHFLLSDFSKGLREQVLLVGADY